MPPLTPAVFHVLLALAGHERHGYAILKEIQRLTDGAVRMQAGTLYGTLQRLLEADMVEEVPAPRKASPDSRRRYYRLTRSGRRVLDAEIQRMAELVRVARAIS
jgi:DNA-binding PadR family transcriptional regulator